MATSRRWLAALALFGCACASADSSLPSVTPEEAAALVAKNEAVLIDVREPNEARGGMAAPAKLMPMSEVKANSASWQKFVAGLDKKQKVIVYCRSGRRSGIVGEKLARMNFTVLNMGGFSSWQKAGLPVRNYEGSE